MGIVIRYSWLKRIMSQTLKTQIMSGREAALGSTPEGADWAIKALHPSDPLTEVRGIPDMSATTSLCMNYQTTATLSPSVGATGTWQFDATLLPHPINLMAVQYTDSAGDHTTEVLNAQISGTTHGDKFQWLLANAQQWRLAYAGVTVTQDGPDLANQGTIVVAQSPVKPYRFPFSLGSSVTTTMGAESAIEVYTAEDLPNYTASQAMPSSYFGQSKFGAYVPLKLTKTAQQWKDQTDVICTGRAAGINLGTVTAPMYALPTAGTYAWPHWDLRCAQAAAATVPWFTMYADRTVGMLNDVMAHISARNLAVTTSYSFFFRFGIEFRVHPASALSPQLKLAPRYDETALTSYFAISRELKDAYPASYNDMGKLWPVISNVAKDILPYLSKSGFVGKGISLAGKGAVLIGDTVFERRMNKKAAKQQKAVAKARVVAKNTPPPLPPRPGRR